MKNLAWKQIIITFLIAFVVGNAFGRWQDMKHARKKWKDPKARQEWVLKRLDSKLGLSADQKEKIAAILQESAPQMEAAREEMWPKIEAVRLQIRQKITPILTPEQQKKYEEMETKWQERKRAKFNA